MGNEPFDIAAFLESREDQILELAGEQVARSRLAHYEAVGPDATAGRLRALLDTVICSARAHRLQAAVEYAASLAAERQGAGYLLSEVQAAINAVEEASWNAITSDVPPASQAYALGVVSTILGAIKDRLACSYLLGVTGHPHPTLRVESLFEGT